MGAGDPSGAQTGVRVRQYFLQRKGGCTTDDLRGSFWGSSLLPKGNVPLERKFATSDKRFKKAKADAKTALGKKVQQRKDLAGQLLLVSLVTGDNDPLVLDTELWLKRRQRKWEKLRWPSCGRKGRTFDQVWGACAKAKKLDGRVQVVRAQEFLRHAGRDSRHTLNQINAWTRGKAGVKKGVHFWTQHWDGGRGSREQWSGSKASFRKVWASLCA